MKDLALSTFVRGQTFAHDLKKLATKLTREERGTAMIEYAVLAGLITAGVIVTVTAIGANIGTRFTTLSAQLSATP